MSWNKGNNRNNMHGATVIKKTNWRYFAFWRPQTAV